MQQISRPKRCALWPQSTTAQRLHPNARPPCRDAKMITHTHTVTALCARSAWQAPARASSGRCRDGPITGASWAYRRRGARARPCTKSYNFYRRERAPTGGERWPMLKRRRRETAEWTGSARPRSGATRDERGVVSHARNHATAAPTVADPLTDALCVPVNSRCSYAAIPDESAARTLGTARGPRRTAVLMVARLGCSNLTRGEMPTAPHVNDGE